MDDIVLDFDNKMFFLILMLIILIVGIAIGVLVSSDSTVSGDTREQKIFNLFEHYLYQEKFCLGTVCVTDDMSWRDIRLKYEQFRNYPVTRNTVTTLYDNFCSFQK